MYVIRTVTCVTVAAAKIPEIASAMAIPTSKATVPANQREAGYGQVIEREHRPGSRTMALRALATVTPLVNVVHLMAHSARAANIAKIGIAMAGRARCENVSASQYEFGRVVVEVCVAPHSHVVARIAGFAKLPVMRIV